MTSSISLAPSTSQRAEGSPPTLTTTKSSFPEIEQVRTSTPHSLIPLQLQINQVTEPFISPLTETNLNYHKSTFPSSRDAKSRYVESFIHNQRLLLEQELDLQHKTMNEIRSMIPLDTSSIEEELIRDDFQRQNRLSIAATDYSTRLHRRYSTLSHSWYSNNDANEQSNLAGAIATEDDEPHATQQMESSDNKPQRSLTKRRWTKIFTRWIRPGHDKKPINSYEEHQTVMETTEPVESSVESNSQLAHDTTSVAPDNRQNIQRQTRRPARHVSWSVGTSYEEYKRQKAAMMEQGLYGLSNANIARALGGSQRGSKAPILFQPEINTPCPTQEPNPPRPHVTPEPQRMKSFRKKDSSGISLVQQSLLSTRTLLRRKSTYRKSNPIDPNNDTGLFVSDAHPDIEEQGDSCARRDTTVIPAHQLEDQRRRRRSTHIMERYAPQLSALEEEDIPGTPALVAFRYPKMVRIKDLRDAAIHILSATENDGDCDQGKHKERYQARRNSCHGCGYDGMDSRNTSRVG